MFYFSKNISLGVNAEEKPVWPMAVNSVAAISSKESDSQSLLIAKRWSVRVDHVWGRGRRGRRRPAATYQQFNMAELTP